MIQVFIKDFFRTGNFGPIKLGMRRDELEQILGEPDNLAYVHSNKRRYAGIYLYGNIEFHFDESPESHLWLIFSDHFQDKLQGGKTVEFDPWFVRQGVSREEVEAELRKCGINYQNVEWPSDDNTTRLLVGAGIELVFINTRKIYEPPPGLTVMSYPASKPPKREHKSLN